MTTIQALDNNTIQRINSGQAITTIDIIIKELLENSLDAGANNIDIKIVNGGLQLIEIKDNGSGILLEDRPYIGKQHYTSKISKFEDLEKLSSFGFRGEALHALCVLAEVQITTKTKNDKVAICYQLDKNGDIISETPSGNISSSGTIVSVLKPFINIPVRRQIVEKTKATTVNRIQDLVIKYSLSHPSVRLSLKQLQNTLGQNKTQPVWIKPTTKCLLDGVRMIYGRDLASMLEEVKYKSINVEEPENEEDDNSDDDVPTLKLNCLLPTKNSDPNLLFKNNSVFVYVNQRPINYFKSNLKELVAMVRQRYKRVLDLANDDNVKSPFMYIDIQTSQNSYDVNIEPDKSIAIFLNKQRILDTMEKLLDNFYGSFFNNTLSHRMEEIPLDSDSHTSMSSQSIALNGEVSTMENFGGDINDIPKTIERNYYDRDTRDEVDEVDELEPEKDQLIDESPSSTIELDENILSTDRNIIKHTAMDMDHIDNHQHYRHNNNNNNNNNNITQTRNSRVNDMDLDCQVEDTPETTHTSELIHTSELNFTSTSHSVNDRSSNLLQSSWFDRFHRKQADTNSDTTTSANQPSFHRRSALLSTSSDINQPKRLRVQSSIDDHLEHTTPARPLHSPHILNTIAHINEQNNDKLIDHHHEQSTKTLSSLLTPPTSSTTQQSLKNSSISGNLHRRRDIESILKPASPFSPLSSISNLSNNTSDDESLICTLNNISIAKTPSTIEALTKNYRQFRHRYSYFYRKPLDEYCQQINSYTSSPPNNENLPYASRVIFSNDPPSTHENNLCFITQNIDTDAGWLIKNIDAVDVIKLLQKHQFQKYMDDYILDCDITLDHPAQLKISKDSCFYNIITSLAKQEQLDDTAHFYSKITDPRIISNGFHAQWRIEPQTNDLIIQITSIADIKGYGLVDFKELLTLMQQNEYQHYNDIISLSKLRPSKVVDYFTKLAKEKANTAYLSKLSSSYESLLENIFSTYLDENKKNNGSKISGSLVYALL